MILEHLLLNKRPSDRLMKRLLLPLWHACLRPLTLTKSALTTNQFAPSNFRPFLVTSAITVVYSEAKLKSISGKTSSSLTSFSVGGVGGRLFSIPCLLWIPFKREFIFGFHKMRNFKTGWLTINFQGKAVI
jgi:hypothetical protein